MLAGGLAAVGHADLDEPGPTTDPRAGQVVRIADARLKFEINATDHDGGIQVFLDADQWKRMSIFDPDGGGLTSLTDGIMAKQGGTELFIESAEPTFDELPLDKLLRRWPAGRYEFRGIGLDGETLKGAARLPPPARRPRARLADRERPGTGPLAHGHALGEGTVRRREPDHRLPGVGRRARHGNQGPPQGDPGRDDAP